MSNEIKHVGAAFYGYIGVAAAISLSNLGAELPRQELVFVQWVF